MSKAVVRKKIPQHELRRIMSEQKKKLSQTIKKVDSPLAKYTEKGQLTCIICESVVRSEAVWTIHINSKQHKDNIAQVKRKKDDEVVEFVPPAAVATKRRLPPDPRKPPKKLKSILKNAPKPAVPLDFFDGDGESVVRMEVDDNDRVNGGRTSAEVSPPESESSEEEGSAGKPRLPEQPVAAPNPDETLPEGFFDDPLLDAKARNVEYKDPVEEEWEKFRKELKEEASLSAQIIAEDQEEATAERQIDEIDEQIRNWTRVLNLEKKKEEVQAVCSKPGAEEDESSSSGDEEQFDEFLDWRAKKSYI